MDGNGKVPPNQDQPEVKWLMQIGVNKNGKPVLNVKKEDMKNKSLCLHLLADAMVIISNFQEKDTPRVVVADGMTFARGLRNMFGGKPPRKMG